MPKKEFTLAELIALSESEKAIQKDMGKKKQIGRNAQAG